MGASSRRPSGGSKSSLPAVFAAGLFTALSPCVLPVAPIIVGGLVVADGASRWARLRASLFFVLGFGVVLVLLGLGVSALAGAAGRLRPGMRGAAALVLMLHGLGMMGLFEGSGGSRG